jgi:FkbM family methyltransferase
MVETPLTRQDVKLMGVLQFANSLKRIAQNRHIDRPTGVVRHMMWQGRKLFDWFPFEQRISQSRIIASDRSCGVSALIYSQGLYDFNNMNLVRAMLRGGGVFADIGANIGSYTLIAAEQPRATVVSFEPHPRTFERLQANVALNHRSNVILVNMAVSDRDGEARLSDEKWSATNHLVGDDRTAIPVRCTRADSWFNGRGLAPSVVKIDVEGFELEVLRGFGDVLTGVDFVLVEINGLSSARSTGGDAVHAHLAAAGFRGPLRYDATTRTLHPLRGSIAEDSVYISQSCERSLADRGLRLASSVPRAL